MFRDRADLSAAHDLGAEIREGLENADALIVLCSPRSCGSKYVNEEIRYFKQLGKGQRIFAVIVDGEPHAAGNPNYTAADEHARVWDASSGRAIATLSGHEDVVRSASFSPDGTRIVTASDDNTARVWDAGSGRAIATLSGHEDGVVSASFSPDGTRIVTASGDTARVWDVRRLTQPMPELALAACTNFLSPDGRRFSALEIGADPLIREVWLRDHGEDRDVCEGVPGASALEPRAPAAQAG